MTRKSSVSVHGKLMSPDSLWARRATDKKANGHAPDADDEFEDVDVDAELERADQYAFVDEDEEEEEEDVVTEDGQITATAAFDHEEDDEPEEDEDYEDESTEDDDDESEEDEDYEDEEADLIDNNVVAVVSRKPFPVPNKEDLTMSSKKLTLSDRVRAEIARLQERGADIRGKDIVNNLKAKGHNVSPAQVSQIMKKEGISSAKATTGAPEKAAAKRSTREPAPRATARVSSRKKTAPETTAEASAPKRSRSAQKAAADWRPSVGVDNRLLSDACTLLRDSFSGDLELCQRYVAAAHAMMIALGE